MDRLFRVYVDPNTQVYDQIKNKIPSKSLSFICEYLEKEYAFKTLSIVSLSKRRLYFAISLAYLQLTQDKGIYTLK